MNKSFFVIGILFVFALCSIVISLNGQSSAGTDTGIGVKIMETEVKGRYLADGNGITLYRFSRDEKNISHCLEGCAVNWPPFYMGESAPAADFEPGDFAAITRTDGRQQTTYKGMSLYYFKNDKYPGDTFGDGIGEVWFLVAP